jgi:hypothetical protein
LSVLLLKLRHFGRFWPKNPRFLSLFSVCLLTIQETTSNEINHLRVGGLQSVLVGLGDREQIDEGKRMKYRHQHGRKSELSGTM